MTDARLPERLLVDRRLLSQSDAVFRAYVTSLMFSVSNRTDGMIETNDVNLMPRFAKTAPTALVKAGLWAETETGWLIVDFDAQQTSRADLEVLENARKRDREKKARQRAGKKNYVGDAPVKEKKDSEPGRLSRTSSWTSERARVAALSRTRENDDPDLTRARADLRVERTAAYIERVVSEAPPLTLEQRARLAALLTGDGAA